MLTPRSSFDRRRTLAELIEESTRAQDGVLVVKDNAEKGTVNLQGVASVIINESQFPEPVHEKANPRASRADHLGQGFLTDFGNGDFVLAFLAEMSQ